MCALFGRVEFGTSYAWQRYVTSVSKRWNPNALKIMTTILEEANAGALTTKGQAIDRRDELVEIDRREFIQAFPEATVLFRKYSPGAAAGTGQRQRSVENEEDGN